MSVHQDILLALDAKIEHATLGLNIDCIKGFPAFDRPDMVIPSAAIWFQRSVPLGQVRVSGSMQEMWQVVFNVAIFAATEPGLMTLVDAYEAMMRTWTKATISSKGMRIAATTLEREPANLGDQTIEALRYAVQGTISFDYAR